MISQLKKFILRQDFHPTWIGVFVNPFFIARYGLAKEIENLAPLISGCLLDVGCGQKPYQKFFYVDQYVGLDIDSKPARQRGIADYYYDGKVFPFDNSTFDAVLCNQVLEHVFNPDEFLSEIHRVLQPGGRLLLTVPFVWDEHEQPFDYARYSSFGLASLLKKNGFRLIYHKKIAADASTIFQLVNAYIFKVTDRFPIGLKLLLTATLMSTITLLGILASKLLPSNQDLFLDHVLLAEKSS